MLGLVTIRGILVGIIVGELQLLATDVNWPLDSGSDNKTGNIAARKCCLASWARTSFAASEGPPEGPLRLANLVRDPPPPAQIPLAATR